ncbi:MAG: hypothetical protein AB7U85_02940 [Alphaproteobacteria bacterium]
MTNKQKKKADKITEISRALPNVAFAALLGVASAIAASDVVLAQSCHSSGENLVDIANRAAALAKSSLAVQVLKLNEKNILTENRYLVAKFVDKPKMGISVLKLNIFDENGNKLSNYKVTGYSDMPSMRGHHDSGENSFGLNNNQDYLLPVNLVMPGDWEVMVKVFDGEEEMYLGQILFDI